MTRYLRRPILEGATASSIMNQPSIRGSIAKNASTGRIPALTVPSDLVVETDTMGGTPLAILLTSDVLTDIVTAVNTALAAGPWGTAEEREGCLQLYSNGTGDGAFISIKQSANDYDFDGVNDDAAPALGFPRDPDPTATVRAGDISPAPVRAAQQGNPQGTSFIAAGEDRVATAYNRALSSLALNADNLYTLLASSVAMPLVLDIDPNDADWASRIIYDGDGCIDQIDLSDLEGMDATWAGRLYVGQLSRTASLSEIAQFWAVTDGEGREILSWVGSASEPRRAVRIGAVTRGQRMTSAPVFADEVTVPTGALSNTTGASPDGLNALGVDRVKITGEAITGIRNRTVVICAGLVSGADFISAGVVVGDIATISGSTNDNPINHNGTYLVEEVIDGRELILRPISNDAPQSLNPSTGGSFGDIEISSSGLWEQQVFVTFDPPVPRFPEGGILRLVVGVERTLGTFISDAMLRAQVKGSEEVSSFAVRQLWHTQTMGGVYGGMRAGAEAGFFGNITGRPVTFAATAQQGHTGGTSVRGPFTGAILDGNILVAESASTPPHPDSFTLADVGRTVRISGTPYLDEELFVIEEVIDGAHARLVAPSTRMNSDIPPATGVEYAIYTASRHDLNAALAIVGPDNVRDPATGPQRSFGTTYIREIVDDALATSPLAGTGYMHVERVKLTYEGAADTNRMDVVVTSFPGSNVLGIDFDPEDTSNIYAEEGGTTKGTPGYQQGTLVRILNGSRAGWYRLKSTISATQRITLLNMDGSTPTAFSNPGFDIYIAFYNVTFSTNAVLRGRPSAGAGSMAAGVTATYDAFEHNNDFGAGLYINWRGVGSGIYSALNDPDFKAYANGDGASGYHTYVRGYVPAHGAWYEFDAKTSGVDAARAARSLTAVVRSYYFDFTQYSTPRATTTDPQGWAGWVHQGGSDPGLIVTKGMPAGPGPGPATLNYAGKAALVVQAKEDVALELQGGAIDSWGPNYNRAGGFYTDSGVGAVYWLYAVNAHRHYPADQEYWDATKGTELGSAGRVVPSTANDSWAAGTLNVPDYTTFPDTPQHATILSLDADALAVLKSNDTELGRYKYLGFVVDVDGGNTYTIVGIHFSTTAPYSVKMALYSGSGTSVTSSSSAVSFRVLGKRWYRSHIDIADWMQIGTGDTTATATELPLVTADVGALNDRVSVVPTTTQIPVLGMQSYCPWAPATEGVSLGVAASTTSAMTNVYVTAATYASAQSWTGDFSSPYFTNGWRTDAKEPRPPFPNAGVISNIDPDHTSNEILNAAYTGNLGADDYAASFPSGTAQVTWSPDWGGSLSISGNSGAQCRIWQRGRTYILKAHLALRVQLRIAASGSMIIGTRSVTTALTRADGTVLATSTSSFTANDKPQDVISILTLNTLSDGTTDLFDYSREADSVHVTILVTLGTTGETISLIEVKTEPQTRAHVVSGPQIVTGSVLAHAYRFTDPVRGFETKSPADVRLLGGLDYARNESWPTYDGGSDGWESSCTTGTQELRGTPGLVRMTSGTSMLDWQIARQLAANDITGDVDAWMTNLKTVATTGYSGSYPASCSAQVAAVSGACDDALAETDPAIKLTLADTAITLAYTLIASVSAFAASLNGGANSGSAFTRANLASYRSDLEDAIAGGGSISDAATYNSLVANSPEENWVRPWVDYFRLFSAGVHSATITLYNGAFDPLWYARQADFIYNTTGSSAGGDLRTDCFVLPGMTGFLIPLNPPHGSVLSSLGIGLSFRAHTDGTWGIYRGMPDVLEQLGRADGSAVSKSYQEVAAEADWDPLQGVTVELWRYNAMDFDVDEEDFASWSEHEPEFGFGERIVQFEIDLSGVTIPTDTVNPAVDAWGKPALLSTPTYDVYVGKEHFEKRVWNLLQMIGGSDRARVDRRHYAYMLVVRFYGGMRFSNAGVYSPYVRGDQFSGGGAAADSRWELPQAITRTKGDPDGELAEGQIYGHFDNAYNVDGVDMNRPWASDSFPPQVKFRGARLGWITDRAGNGGW